MFYRMAPVLLILVVAGASAECTESERKAGLDEEVVINEEPREILGNEYIKYSVRAPQSLLGLTFAAMHLNKGGVLGYPSIKVPLAFQEHAESVESEFQIAKSEDGNFTIRVDYKSDSCNKSVYTPL